MTIVALVAVYYFTRETADLRYTVTRTEPFYGTSAATAIYKIEIKNQGKKEVDAFRCDIRFFQGRIEDKRISASPGVLLSEKSASDSENLSSDVLNPGDSIEASYLVTFASAATDPQISVRGKGVTGTPLGGESGPWSWIHKFGLEFMALIFFTSAFASGVSRQFTRSRRASTGHESSRRDVLAIGFFTLGLHNEGAKLLQLRKCHYWSQSDRIASEYVAEADQATRARAAEALSFAINYGSHIADISVDIVHYNIAVLFESAGRTDRALDHLMQAAKSASPYVLKRLCANDAMIALATKNLDRLPHAWLAPLHAIEKENNVIPA